jgi:hypothetical protein
LLQESRCKVRLKADPTAEKVLQDNANITFNPATGAPYPFSNRATRAFPMWGVVGQQMFTGWSNYHGLQSVFTKRFTHRWQGSLTYTLSGLRDGDPAPLSGIKQVSFPVAPDFGGEYGLAVTDQRHRLVFNGIWQVVGGLRSFPAITSSAIRCTALTCGSSSRSSSAAAVQAI